MGLGWTEIILIGVVLLFLFGPSRLPGMGKSLGEAIRGFKKGLESIDEEDAPKSPTRVVHSNQDQLPGSEQGQKTTTEQKEKQKSE